MHVVTYNKTTIADELEKNFKRLRYIVIVNYYCDGLAELQGNEVSFAETQKEIWSRWETINQKHFP